MEPEVTLTLTGEQAHRVKGSAQIVIIVAVIVAIFKPGVAMRLHRTARDVPRQAVQILKQHIRA